MNEADIRIELENFRFWLASDIDMGIMDEPPTTCLTIARARIVKLKENLDMARKLLSDMTDLVQELEKARRQANHR